MTKRSVRTWVPVSVGWQFETRNVGYTEPKVGCPEYVRKPRGGVVVADNVGAHWRVAIMVNGAGSEFLEVQYHVLFNNRTKPEWVAEHIVSGR